MGTKVLVADDEAANRRLVQKLLGDWGYEVIAVEDGVSALRELESPQAPSLAVLDWMMPGLSGPEVVHRIRATKPSPYVYAVLLTAKSNRSDIVLGLESGADDFLTKPVDAQELRARLRAGERIINLQSRLAHALTVSEFRAGHDALTGLYNRPMILNLLERERAESRREGTPVGLILADIDRFRPVNDAHGHPGGDEVLLEVAGRMLSGLRSHHFLGRYGGEEFLVVAPGCGPDRLPELAERLRHAVGRNPICVGDKLIDITISLGSTLIRHPENIGSSLDRADLALYHAKHAGRNMSIFRSGPGGEVVNLASEFPLPPTSALLPLES